MSERLRNLLFVIAMVGLAVTLTVMVVSQPSSQDRVSALGNRIMCPVCQGESIADSSSQMARDMMSLISDEVDQGATDQQIVDELLSSYSGAVLLDPPVGGSTLVLWVAPIAALLIGLGVIIWWRRHPGGREPATGEPLSRRSRWVTVLGLVGVFVVIVVVAANFLQQDEGSNEGVANIDQTDLADVSDETMEAVITANADNPQIDGMRLALAERYYQEGDYQKAFPHFLAVAQSPTASDAQVAGALIRLGWMAYDGNGEVDTATTLLDQALAIEPDSSLGLYLKAKVRWCGAGEADTAIALFQRVLEGPDLDSDSRAQVESDLDRARSGGSCP